MSFGGADALVLSGWTGYGAGAAVDDDLDPPWPFYYPSVARAAARCVTAPESKQPGGPSGWVYLLTTRAEFELLVHDIDPHVFDAFVELFEQDPCGYGRDVSPGVAATLSLAPTVAVPVLLAYGDRDPGAPAAAVELQRARYAAANEDVSSLIVLGTAHLPMLERAAPVFRAGLSHWLQARGF